MNPDDYFNVELAIVVAVMFVIIIFGLDVFAFSVLVKIIFDVVVMTNSREFRKSFRTQRHLLNIFHLEAIQIWTFWFEDLKISGNKSLPELLESLIKVTRSILLHFIFT